MVIKFDFKRARSIAVFSLFGISSNIILLVSGLHFAAVGCLIIAVTAIIKNIGIFVAEKRESNACGKAFTEN